MNFLPKFETILLTFADLNVKVPYSSWKTDKMILCPLISFFQSVHLITSSSAFSWKPPLSTGCRCDHLLHIQPLSCHVTTVLHLGHVMTSDPSPWQLSGLIWWRLWDAVECSGKKLRNKPCIRTFLLKVCLVFAVCGMLYKNSLNI